MEYQDQDQIPGFKPIRYDVPLSIEEAQEMGFAQGYGRQPTDDDLDSFSRMYINFPWRRSEEPLQKQLHGMIDHLNAAGLLTRWEFRPHADNPELVDLVGVPISVPWCPRPEDVDRMPEAEILKYMDDLTIRGRLWRAVSTIANEAVRESACKFVQEGSAEEVLARWKELRSDDNVVGFSPQEMRLREEERKMGLFLSDEELARMPEYRPQIILVRSPKKRPELKADEFIGQTRAETLLAQLSGPGNLFRPDDDSYERNPDLVGAGVEAPEIRFPYCRIVEDMIYRFSLQGTLWDMACRSTADDSLWQARREDYFTRREQGLLGPDEVEPPLSEREKLRRRIISATYAYNLEDILTEFVGSVEGLEMVPVKPVFTLRGFSAANPVQALPSLISDLRTPGGLLDDECPPELAEKVLPREQELTEQQAQGFIVTLNMRDLLWQTCRSFGAADCMQRHAAEARRQILSLEPRFLPHYITMLTGIHADRGEFQEATGVKPYLDARFDNFELPEALGSPLFARDGAAGEAAPLEIPRRKEDSRKAVQTADREDDLAKAEFQPREAPRREKAVDHLMKRGEPELDADEGRHATPLNDGEKDPEVKVFRIYSDQVQLRRTGDSVEIVLNGAREANGRRSQAVFALTDNSATSVKQAVDNIRQRTERGDCDLRSLFRALAADDAYRLAELRDYRIRGNSGSDLRLKLAPVALLSHVSLEGASLEIYGRHLTMNSVSLVACDLLLDAVSADLRGFVLIDNSETYGNIQYVTADTKCELRGWHVKGEIRRTLNTNSAADMFDRAAK